MSLRDFNEPPEPMALHTDPAGNSAGLGSFHTTSPEDREPSNTPKIVGALAVALMVGAAGIGLYAYSGSSQPKPVVADNNLPQPPAPAAAPVAPRPRRMHSRRQTRRPTPPRRRRPPRPTTARLLRRPIRKPNRSGPGTIWLRRTAIPARPT